MLTVAGVIGGPWLSLQPGAGPREHNTYWWLVIIGSMVLVVSVAMLVRRSMVRRR
jgi:hypothetical protein